MTNQSTQEKFKAAKPAFDIIDQQIFNDQFSSETSKQLDKLFLSAMMDGEIDTQERNGFCLMYFNLKRLLQSVTTSVEPNAIEGINLDISFYVSS